MGVSNLKEILVELGFLYYRKIGDFEMKSSFKKLIEDTLEDSHYNNWRRHISLKLARGDAASWRKAITTPELNNIDSNKSAVADSNCVLPVPNNYCDDLAKITKDVVNNNPEVTNIIDKNYPTTLYVDGNNLAFKGMIKSVMDHQDRSVDKDRKVAEIAFNKLVSIIRCVSDFIQLKKVKIIFDGKRPSLKEFTVQMRKRKTISVCITNMLSEFRNKVNNDLYSKIRIDSECVELDRGEAESWCYHNRDIFTQSIIYTDDTDILHITATHLPLTKFDNIVILVNDNKSRCKPPHNELAAITAAAAPPVDHRSVDTDHNVVNYNYCENNIISNNNNQQQQQTYKRKTFLETSQRLYVTTIFQGMKIKGHLVRVVSMLMETDYTPAFFTPSMVRVILRNHGVYSGNHNSVDSTLDTLLAQHQSDLSEESLSRILRYLLKLLIFNTANKFVWFRNNTYGSTKVERYNNTINTPSTRAINQDSTCCSISPKSVVDYIRNLNWTIEYSIKGNSVRNFNVEDVDFSYMCVNKLQVVCHLLGPGYVGKNYSNMNEIASDVRKQENNGMLNY